MKSLLPLLLLFVLSPFTGSGADGTEDGKFERLAEKFTAEYLERNPEEATSLGDHRYDSRLNDYSRAGREADLASARGYLQELAKISEARLSRQNQVDYRIFKDRLEAAVVELDQIRAFEWNPLHYNAASPIYHLLARDYAPLPVRLRAVKGRLEGITNLIQQARLNLKNPPPIHTETAIQQNEGSIHLIREELNAVLAEAPEARAELAPVQAGAIRALQEYGRWLKEDLLPRSKGDFRFGEARFNARLRYSLGSDLSREEILQKAEAELKKTQAEMYETALPLYRKWFPGHEQEEAKNVIKAVLDRLADEHPTDATIVAQARRDLEACTQFVRERQIVSIPDEPLQIIVMPEFKRGVAVAYCDAPGALAKNEATFYAISPTPVDWTETRKVSFYREYNNYMMKNLTVHEAMPGHFLQLIHANRFKAPTRLRAIFSSGIFAEGWGTYAEQVMARLGFGGPEVKMQQLKMRLRLIINAILDQKIHTGAMTEKQAIDLMRNEGFQEEGEAAGKWKRACLTATQLSTYFVGNLEVNDLIARYQKQHPQASMKAMHDEILGFGSVAPKHLKPLFE